MGYPSWDGIFGCVFLSGKYQTGKWTQIFNYIELLGNLVSFGKTFDGRFCWSGTPRNPAFIIPATMVMMLPMMSTGFDRWFECFLQRWSIFLMIMFYSDGLVQPPTCRFFFETKKAITTFQLLQGKRMWWPQPMFASLRETCMSYACAWHSPAPWQVPKKRWILSAAIGVCVWSGSRVERILKAETLLSLIGIKQGRWSMLLHLIDVQYIILACQDFRFFSSNHVPFLWFSPYPQQRHRDGQL